MEIIQMRPEAAVITSLVESYLFISRMDPMSVTTLPNGRVDATIILDGKIEWLYRKKNKYMALPAFCFYPLTNRVNLAASKSILRCISIKFYPHILTFAPFKDKTFEEPRPFSYFFKSTKLNNNLLKDLRKAADNDAQISLLDKYFMSILFPNEGTSAWLQKVTSHIEKGTREKIKIQEIASSMEISIKTLERKFIGITGLTPKEYMKIIQLQKTILNFKKMDEPFSHGDLTKLLGTEYFDQAHFVKSCRNITGLTPKQLFVKLPKGITDVLLIK